MAKIKLTLDLKYIHPLHLHCLIDSHPSHTLIKDRFPSLVGAIEGERFLNWCGVLNQHLTVWSPTIITLLWWGHTNYHLDLGGTRTQCLEMWHIVSHLSTALFLALYV